MDRREKLEFLLEQMRLCLAKYDYIRTQIISKKINIKAFEDEASHVSFQINKLIYSVHL
jgi:26S proteasome regulatory subunit N5